MSFQPVLIAGSWREAQTTGDFFTAANPAIKSPLPERYPVSSSADVELALQSAQEAVAALRAMPVEAIADFLEQFASNIEARSNDLVELAHVETALPKEPRLRSVELPRTADQLRQAAAAVRERSWCQATIDAKLNIRAKYGPLGGAVAVFGPNNFPFAFNSCAGGDFAAAIAAGNPVIAKANTGHPGATRVFAEAAFEAVKATGLPKGMVQLIYRLKPADGLKLVSHPLLGATGFTGSKYAGLQLKEAADRAGKPIYLEMSSVNPIFILPGALEERPEQVANELFASCSLGAGQFCTNPGLVILRQDAAGEAFAAALAGIFQQNKPGILLSQQGPAGIAEAIEILQEHGAEVTTGGYEVAGSGYCFANTVLRVSGEDFVKHPHALQTEAFGAVTLLVFAKDTAQLSEIASQLEGNLTGCIYSHTQGQDDELYRQLEPILRQKVGRLLNDKMPTGVAVTPAMNHGGPYPATGHPGFTAVGIPASLLRFAALHSYDNVRQHRLPPELQNKNPTGRMWRFIDREWTQGDV